jgi:hypothetical protein
MPVRLDNTGVGVWARRLALLALLLAPTLRAQQVATTITLTVSNTTPAYTTPVNASQPINLTTVTLTATVLETATNNPVGGGTVTFYDNAGVPGAAGPDVIGTASIQYPTPGGDLGLLLRPGDAHHHCRLQRNHGGARGRQPAGDAELGALRHRDAGYRCPERECVSLHQLWDGQ